MLVAVYSGLAGMLRPPLKFSGDGLGVVAALTLICWQGENSLLKSCILFSYRLLHPDRA